MKRKCFEHHSKINLACDKKKCRYWINLNSHKNCCLIASKKTESFTLQDIGNIFKVTRMRICQIEKSAINKLKDKIFKS